LCSIPALVERYYAEYPRLGTITRHFHRPRSIGYEHLIPFLNVAYVGILLDPSDSANGERGIIDWTGELSLPTGICFVGALVLAGAIVFRIKRMRKETNDESSDWKHLSRVKYLYPVFDQEGGFLDPL
jgi:hypothetical protein